MRAPEAALRCHDARAYQLATRMPSRGVSEFHHRQQRDEVCPVKLFNVHVAGTGEVLCVAARTSHHAAEVFVTFWLARTGDAPGEFSIGRGAPSEYQGDFTVENLRRGDVAGVVVRQANGLMLFEPPMGG
jgi:hypothetical protein